jgi:hypothetical protein
MTPEQVHADLEDLKRELKLELRELRVEFKEQFHKIKVLIWLPVITGAIQILVLLLRHN